MSNNPPLPENGAVYELMRKSMVQPDRSQMKTRRMRVAYWITKATDTLSEYVLLTAFHGNSGYANALQCYVYVHCLFFKDSMVYSGSMKPNQASGAHFIVNPIIILLSTHVIPDLVRLFK